MIAVAQCGFLSFIFLALATLQQVADTEILVKQRKRQLELRQKAYKWHCFEDTGVPSAIVDQHNLPLDEQFQKGKMINLFEDALKAKLASSAAEGEILVLHELENTIHSKRLQPLKNLYDFEMVAVELESMNYEMQKDYIPTHVGSRWVSDVEFGRQILNGVNPVLIRRCTKIPENFQVTSDMVQPFMYNGKTLDQEMQVS